LCGSVDCFDKAVSERNQSNHLVNRTELVTDSVNPPIAVYRPWFRPPNPYRYRCPECGLCLASTNRLDRHQTTNHPLLNGQPQ
jgi:hypothetical protein